MDKTGLSDTAFGVAVLNAPKWETVGLYERARSKKLMSEVLYDLRRANTYSENGFFTRKGFVAVSLDREIQGYMTDRMFFSWGINDPAQINAVASCVKLLVDAGKLDVYVAPSLDPDFAEAVAILTLPGAVSQPIQPEQPVPAPRRKALSWLPF